MRRIHWYKLANYDVIAAGDYFIHRSKNPFNAPNEVSDPRSNKDGMYAVNANGDLIGKLYSYYKALDETPVDLWDIYRPLFVSTEPEDQDDSLPVDHERKIEPDL